MTPRLTCACLVTLSASRLLLVRVRDNPLWYLPGGKIEPGETPPVALARELLEELNLEISPGGFEYLYNVIGPAYGLTGEVELLCYTADWSGPLRPAAEISDTGWLGWDDRHLFAPAVQILYERYILPHRTA